MFEFHTRNGIRAINSTGRRDENGRDYIRWCFADREIAAAFAIVPLGGLGKTAMTQNYGSRGRLDVSAITKGLKILACRGRVRPAQSLFWPCAKYEAGLGRRGSGLKRGSANSCELATVPVSDGGVEAAGAHPSHSIWLLVGGARLRRIMEPSYCWRNTR
jgi:hypothetical protein